MKKIFFVISTVLIISLFAACAKEGENTTAENIHEPVITTEESNTLPKAEADRLGEDIYKNHPELTPVNYESPAILGKSEDMGQEYIDKLTFICDSPTYWMWPFGFLKDGADTNSIWTGPEGTMTLAYQSDYCILDPYDNAEKPIRQVVEEHKPEYLIIAVGINGISFMDEEYFKREYTDLVTDIKAISPDTKLMCQSIYPITPAYRNWGDITNEMITEANSWILEIAEENACRYLDSFSILLAEDGNAIPELMMKDGLHPNEEGLAKVIEYIRTHAWVDYNTVG
ncbi:MAG: SGNH/GDSL hydrolase family protein [Clostridia bacterium]|nr:SGNH/GDSL hydrolase family protein [Clostridia bacterium]